jgi:hypothetical protein
MDHDDKDEGLRVARSLAASGEYANWRAVEVKLRQLGYRDAANWFGDQVLRGDTDALCAANRRA